MLCVWFFVSLFLLYMAVLASYCLCGMAMDHEVDIILAAKRAGIDRMRERQRRVHHGMALMVESRPEVIGDAVKRVKARLEGSVVASKEIYEEWLVILESWPIERVVALLRDDAVDGEQLRACAPFDLER